MDCISALLQTQSHLLSIAPQLVHFSRHRQIQFKRCVSCLIARLHQRLARLLFVNMPLRTILPVYPSASGFRQDQYLLRIRVSTKVLIYRCCNVVDIAQSESPSNSEMYGSKFASQLTFRQTGYANRITNLDTACSPMYLLHAVQGNHLVPSGCHR